MDRIYQIHDICHPFLNTCQRELIDFHELFLIKIIGYFIGFDFYLLTTMNKNGMFLLSKLKSVIVGHFFQFVIIK